MIKIEGKVNTAICYASVVEEGAIQQIKRMCDYEFTSSSKVRIMPDVHAGKGCTIGITMTVADRVVPNIVGVDIGCGMYTVDLGKGEIDFKRLDAASHGIPSGMKVWDRAQETFDFESLKCYKQLKKVNWLKCSLGTLGGGNHFIEVEVSRDGTKYLVIHSGSRNLGKQVAELYQEMAINQHKGIGKYFESRESIIERLKAQGRESEIEDALAELKKKKENEVPDIPEDLCDLSGEPFEDYLHDIELCQQFARRNREIMASIILKRLGINGTDAFHTIHNYIDTKEMILRKGAIAAHKGEKVLIPINMRDGSILAVGKGNSEWNYSAPHGAGRVMSRMKAKQALSMKAYQEMMKGIYTTSVTQATLDEAPMAYKSLEDIIDVIGESVEIIEILKPIYNFKSSE
jgi:hypothetical protein